MLMAQQHDHSSHKTVNLNELLTRVENDHKLLLELVDIFKKDLPDLLQSLQKSVAREDMKSVEATSHALKGMLAGLSVTQAAPIVVHGCPSPTSWSPAAEARTWQDRGRVSD
jgi:HPt (histidine-containing phosphotransfer) domain-containing protein